MPATWTIGWLPEIDHSDADFLMAQATPVEIRTSCMNFEE
jgi:hypothetical protein